MFLSWVRGVGSSTGFLKLLTAVSRPTGSRPHTRWTREIWCPLIRWLQYWRNQSEDWKIRTTRGNKFRLDTFNMHKGTLVGVYAILKFVYTLICCMVLHVGGRVCVHFVPARLAHAIYEYSSRQTKQVVRHTVLSVLMFNRCLRFPSFWMFEMDVIMVNYMWQPTVHYMASISNQVGSALISRSYVSSTTLKFTIVCVTELCVFGRLLDFHRGFQEPPED